MWKEDKQAKGLQNSRIIGSWFLKGSSDFLRRSLELLYYPYPRYKKLQQTSNCSHKSWDDPKGFNTVDGSEILHQLRLVVYNIIYRVLWIPGGAGFLPSTVVKGYQRLWPKFPHRFTPRGDGGVAGDDISSASIFNHSSPGVYLLFTPRNIVTAKRLEKPD